MPPAAPDFSFVFRRPFSEQVAFFRGKLGHLVPTQTWRDIMRAQHDRAFMVAGAAKADLLADLAAAVDKAISEGEGLQAFRQRFGEIVKKHGWTGWTGSESKAGTAWRTRVIYRTNMATSYAAGRLAQLKHFPVWVYRHSGAEHPRLQHKAWDGLTLPADHEFWRTHYPPNGWNCFPGDTQVRCDALLGQRVWYAGEMVELHTALGHRLAVTANHPILTRRGWVAAKDIEQGDELISAALDIDAPVPGIVDHEQPPARAEDLFEALAAQRLRIVPVAPDDFYGDAFAMKGEIHIAGGDCGLMHVVESARRELGGKCGLDGALHGRVEPADVACGAAQVSLVLPKSAPAKDILDGRLGDAEPQGDGSRAGQAGSVETDDGAVECVVARVGGGPGLGEETLAPAAGRLDCTPGHLPGGGAVAQRDSGHGQRARDGAPAAPMLFRQLLDANAGLVAPDHVVEIRKFYWSGHVYDFTTSTGLIIAGGIVVSNCGCRVVGASSADAARRLGGNPDYNAPPPGWDARDAKGRMPGIDEGWDYMPGRKAEAIKGIARALARHDPVMADLAATFAPKTIAWPYELAKAYMSGVPADMRDALAIAQRSQAETGAAARRYAARVLADGPQAVEPYRTMGLLTQDEAREIARMTGVDAVARELYDWTIDRFSVVHIRNEHGDDAAEARQGQSAVVVNDYALLPRLIAEARGMEYGGLSDTKRHTVRVVKIIDGIEYNAVFELLPRRRMLALKSMWKRGRPPILRP